MTPEVKLFLFPVQRQMRIQQSTGNLERSLIERSQVITYNHSSGTRLCTEMCLRSIQCPLTAEVRESTSVMTVTADHVDNISLYNCPHGRKAKRV